MLLGMYHTVLSPFLTHILAHSSLRKVVRVEIPQSDVAALDNEVKEAHALKKNTIGGFDQINKTYRTIWK